MGIMGLDTIVKVISLKIISKREERLFRDVFKSKMLRKGYIYKGAGYFLFAGAIFPLDYYMLTPFLEGLIKFLSWNLIIPTTAVFTNLLLIIFCIIEIASINENWFDISGNNIFKSVYNTVKMIRGGIESTVSFVKNTKNDL